MAMTKFYIVYRAAAKAWFVTTGTRTVTASEVAGPFPRKAEAISYARDRAKNMGTLEHPTQVLSQEKGKRRFNTEATYPRAADPRDTKGTARRKS